MSTYKIFCLKTIVTISSGDLAPSLGDGKVFRFFLSLTSTLLLSQNPDLILTIHGILHIFRPSNLSDDALSAPTNVLVIHSYSLNENRPQIDSITFWLLLKRSSTHH